MICCNHENDPRPCLVYWSTDTGCREIRSEGWAGFHQCAGVGPNQRCLCACGAELPEPPSLGQAILRE